AFFRLCPTCWMVLRSYRSGLLEDLPPAQWLCMSGNATEGRTAEPPPSPWAAGTGRSPASGTGPVDHTCARLVRLHLADGHIAVVGGYGDDGNIGAALAAVVSGPSRSEAGKLVGSAAVSGDRWYTPRLRRGILGRRYNRHCGRARCSNLVRQA